MKDSGSTYVYTYLKLQAGSPGYSIHLDAAINVLELQLKSPTSEKNASPADRGSLWLLKQLFQMTTGGSVLLFSQQFWHLVGMCLKVILKLLPHHAFPQKSS